MKELTFSIQNKQEQELSIVMQGHKVPFTIVVGTSHMDLEMEDVDDLIKALHMMKSQHKTFVNVEPMGVEDLKKPNNQASVYANLPTPPKVENKKEETVPQIQLKIGQKYKDRVGHEFTVTGEVGTGSWQYEQGYRFFADRDRITGPLSYMPNGRFIADGHDHDYDLVELIEDVPSQPDKDEHGRWILNEGDTVMLSNDVEGVVLENDKSNLPYKIQFPFEDDIDHEWFYGTEGDKKGGLHITSIIKRAK